MTRAKWGSFMNERASHIFKFDDFTLNPDEGLLLRAGEEVPLAPKAFETLVLLVSHHGHLVKKNDILDRVWGDTFVEEAVIPQCISAIRNALVENPKSPIYIRTEPKRGYRFIAPVEVFSGGAVEPEPPNQSSLPLGAITSIRQIDNVGFVTHQVVDDNERRPIAIEEKTHTPAGPASTGTKIISSGQKRFLLAASVFAICAFAAAAYYLASQTSASEGQLVRLGVLPIKPIDPGKREPSLEFAIADALILKLSESKAFEINRLNTVRKFVDLEGDPIEAGRELNVEYVLSSHYQVVDGRVRVTAQLLNVQNGSMEQSFIAESDMTSIFDVQDAISNDIGNAVLSRFGRPASLFVARRGTENEEAYSLYQQAWYLIDKGTESESDKAAKLLDKAVELDPNYAQAWAVRSHAYCQFAHLGGGEPTSVFTTAEPMLERAMLIDPNNAMAYTIRGTINRDYHWNLPEAISDLQRGIELDPSIVLAHRVLAGVYYRNGQFIEAVESQKRAVDLHPTSLTDQRDLGTYLVAAGRKPEGIAQLNRVAELSPYPKVYQSLWEIHHAEGNYPKAYENFLRLKELWGRPQEEIAIFKKAYNTHGWPGVLRAELEWVRSMEPKGKYCQYKYYIAAIAALTGDNDLAFEYIDLAIKYRLVGVSFLMVDPKFASLRNDPRFEGVLDRAGLIRRSQV